MLHLLIAFALVLFSLSFINPFLSQDPVFWPVFPSSRVRNLLNHFFSGLLRALKGFENGSEKWWGGRVYYC